MSSLSPFVGRNAEHFLHLFFFSPAFCNVLFPVLILTAQFTACIGRPQGTTQLIMLDRDASMLSATASSSTSSIGVLIEALGLQLEYDQNSHLTTLKCHPRRSPSSKPAINVALGWKSATRKLVVLLQILCTVLPWNPDTPVLVSGPAALPTSLS